VTREEIIGLFMENAEEVDAEAVRVTSVDELNRTVGDLVGSGKRIYCPRNTDLEKALSLTDAAETEDFMDAEVCVQEVAAGIAETGSIISTSQGGKPVQAGLLPSHHVAIVSSSNILETFDGYFAGRTENVPTNITVETGPSRTADIELTLTIGVHGPDRLTIVLIDS
jgi:L-lactate dehydrogenase complex protein LldG